MKKKVTIICFVLLIICAALIGFSISVVIAPAKGSEPVESVRTERLDGVSDTEVQYYEIEPGVYGTIDPEYSGKEDSNEFYGTLSDPADVYKDAPYEYAEELLTYAELVPMILDYYDGDVVYLGYGEDYGEYYFSMSDDACTDVVVMETTQDGCGPNGDIISKDEAYARIGGNNE